MPETALPALTGSPRLELYRLSSATETLMLLPLARAAHLESVQSQVPFSERKLLAQVTDVLRRGDKGACFYCSYNSKAIGVINLAVGEAWLGEGGCFATCLHWYVLPAVRSGMLGGRTAVKLLEHAKRWAKSRGAVELYVHGTLGERPSLARMGQSIGMNIRMEL